MPRILLAEDDPVSREFLASALHKLECEVKAVADGDAAVHAACVERFDLLILDHRMPGMNGDAVLHAVRGDARAASHDVVAVATTAESGPALHAFLCDAGFAQVLVKPLNAARLREGLREVGIVFADDALDDHAGLAASGGTEALSALRGLFAKELDALAVEMDDLRENMSALTERLHRLRASCGFCGALALKDAAAMLSDALRAGDPACVKTCHAQFQQALTATREALNCA